MTPAPDVTASLKAVLARKKQTFPQHVNRISTLDDPCLRRLYYMRTAWDKVAPTEDGLQGIFETGSILESIIERIVSEAGETTYPRWRIVGTQTGTKDSLLDKFQISGTLDGFVQVESVEELPSPMLDNNTMLPVYMTRTGWQTIGVVDIKTMSSNVYARVQTVEDLARYPWTAKYKGQVMLYALAHNLDRCFLLLVNKNNLYDMKLLEFPLDFEHCETLLGKAATVNAAIDAGEPPEGVNRADICSKCRWLSYCAPPIEPTGAMRIDETGELEAILDELEQLEPSANRYAELESERDALLVKGDTTVAGKWMITWTPYQRRNAKTGVPEQFWRKTITKVMVA